MITFRRHYLDHFLQNEDFSGDVLDIGGERESPRGQFRAPAKGVSSWRFLNVDPGTDPDIVCSAMSVPLPDGSANVIKLTEVLEHLEDPHTALRECYRLLRPGGKLVVSVPFLINVHGDPSDFTRWTGEGLRKLMISAGFNGVVVEPMGGLVAVFSDLFEHFCHHVYTTKGVLPFRLRVMRGLLRKVFLWRLLKIDGGLQFKNEFTTGYFVRAFR